MAKGIIYVMATVVPGLIKIGKTRQEQFENRMNQLERNGISNVTGLKREFAIKVDDYDEKEKLIHDIFSKSRIRGTELFALDIDIAKSLLSSLEGTPLYPTDKTKNEVFKKSTEEINLKDKDAFIPDGEYVLKREVKNFGEVSGKAIVKDGIFTVLKGSVCANTSTDHIPSCRQNAKIKNNFLQEDIICTSPSSAGWIILGKSNNGWKEWKDSNGNPIDTYRSNDE